MLQPFARELIDGATPLYLFEKPSPGTGATLLVDMLTFPSTGGPIATMTEGSDEDEWRKRITAKLMTGPQFILIDNLRRRLDSAAVSSAITSPTWEDRILTTSTIANLPVRCAWIATGNNPAVSSEIARRVVRCRLDAKQDRPWLREQFKHRDLRTWAHSNRGRLIWSALTIIKAWIIAGRPLSDERLGMFESWSSIMGGILANAGIGGFLDNLTEFYDASDSEGEQWRALLTAWWQQHGSKPVLSGDLFTIADQCDMQISGNTERAQKTRFGKMLGQQRDRTYNVVTEDGEISLTVTDAGKYRRTQQWRLDMQTAQSGCERCEPCERFGPRTEKSDSEKCTMGKNVHTRSHVHTDCNHTDPSTFEHRGGKAFCPGCNRFMGRVQAEGTDAEVVF